MLPKAETDVPTELVSVTETEAIALRSPVNGNGICRWKAPPAACPSGLANHVVDLSANGSTKLPPFTCAPATAAKLTLALAKSRGVELAVSSKVKLESVILLIRTEPDVM